MANRMSEQTKQQIRTAFFKILKDRSYEEITVGDIAEGAGISRRTFYRAYRDKGDIVEQYLEETVRSWMIYARNQPIDSYDRVIDLMFGYWNDFVPELKIFVEVGMGPIILKKYNRICPDYFREFIATSRQLSWRADKLNGDRIEFGIYISVGALWNVFSQWLIDPRNMTLDELKNFVKNEFRMLGGKQS